MVGLSGDHVGCVTPSRRRERECLHGGLGRCWVTLHRLDEEFHLATLSLQMLLRTALASAPSIHGAACSGDAMRDFLFGAGEVPLGLASLPSMNRRSNEVAVFPSGMSSPPCRSFSRRVSINQVVLVSFVEIVEP